MPTSTAMSPKCSIDIATCISTCSLLLLPVVYCGYVYIYLHSLLWVPVVYYGYLWSTKAMPICSLQCCLVFCTQLLYYAYLVFIITASMLLSLHCLLSLPILLSGLLTHSCIPCLVYMTIQSAMSKQSSELPIAFYVRLVSFSNFRSILSNSTYIMEFAVSSNARCNKIRQRLRLHFVLKSPISIDSDSIKLTFIICAIIVCYEKNVRLK